MKIDLVEEEHDSEHEESESSGDESEDEEPRIKDVLSHLSERCRKSVLSICFFLSLFFDKVFKTVSRV